MKFASQADYEVCRKIHREFGTSYYFATQLFPKRIARRVDAVYGFVRVPDEWVDNPGLLSVSDIDAKFDDWLTQFEESRPTHPVMRAFCDVASACGMPPEEPRLFMEAMKMDLTKTRYRTYEELQSYMRGSASAVGLMMCSIMELPDDPAMLKAASILGEAMQMTNFLRDVREDAVRGRIYLPLEDLDRFGVSEQDVLSATFTDNFRSLIKFEVSRTRWLYEAADEGILSLPKNFMRPVLLARILYSKILEKIEQQNFDVFAGRARTTKVEKVMSAGKVLLFPWHVTPREPILI